MPRYMAFSIILSLLLTNNVLSTVIQTLENAAKTPKSSIEFDGVAPNAIYLAVASESVLEDSIVLFFNLRNL